MPFDSPRPVRRDRHNRGLRGPLLPHRIPGYVSRKNEFTRLMENALADLDVRFKTSLSQVTFATESIPNLRDLLINNEEVALGRTDATWPVQIVLYVEPIRMRASNKRELDRIIRDVLAEQLSPVLGMRPEKIDPEYLGPSNR